MRMKRREFLAKSLIGVGGVLLESKFAAAMSGKPGTFDPYELVRLGKTGLKVSRVGFGTGTKGWGGQSNQTRLGKEKFQALLLAAYERGIRLFDLADVYGSHPYVVGALKKIPRDNYVIVSKIWVRSRGPGKEENRDPQIVIERFLKEINTDYIDLLLLHCLSSQDWPIKFRRHMDSLEHLKQKGLIRAHGISCHSLGALEAAANEPWVESVHARINAYGEKMDGPPEKVAPLLKRLHRTGIGVVSMKLIGEGKFRDSDQMRDNSIRYVLSLGCVDTMIVGFESAQEIDDFAARVRKVPGDLQTNMYRRTKK